MRAGRPPPPPLAASRRPIAGFGRRADNNGRRTPHRPDARSLMLTLLLASAVAATMTAYPDADPPARELFAAEPWYKGMSGKEEAFVGRLQRTDQAKGVVGFGRNNAYRLVM